MNARLASSANREALQIAGDCYYEHTVLRGPARAALEGTIDVDVGVVGGGFAGLCSALELAQRGYRVALLEAERIASGASGRNGGQLLPGFSCDIDVLAAQLGPSGARRAWDLSIEGMALVHERAQSVPGACDLRPGWLLLAARAGHVEKLRAWYAQLRDTLDYGTHVELVEGAATREWSGSDCYHAGLIDRFAGHLNPLKLGLALAAQCTQCGVQVFENTPVRRVRRASGPVLETPSGEVRCRRAVIASNVFVDGLGLDIARRIMPVGNSIIATEPLSEALAASLMRESFAACDTNFLLDYYRLTPDRRLLWGGGATYLRHDSPTRIDGLRRKMLRVYPQLEAVRIDFSWGGLIDVTVSRAPDFGRIDDSLYYLQGFSGHGLNVTAIAGRLAAEAIDGHVARFDLLARLAHRSFPGGPLLRGATLSLGTWYYRARDFLAR